MLDSSASDRLCEGQALVVLPRVIALGESRHNGGAAPTSHQIACMHMTGALAGGDCTAYMPQSSRGQRSSPEVGRRRTASPHSLCHTLRSQGTSLATARQRRKRDLERSAHFRLHRVALLCRLLEPRRRRADKPLRSPTQADRERLRQRQFEPVGRAHVIERLGTALHCAQMQSARVATCLESMVRMGFGHPATGAPSGQHG